MKIVIRNCSSPAAIELQSNLLNTVLDNCVSPSSLVQKLKADVAKIKQGTPGRRFIDHYERSRRTEDPRKTRWKTVAYVAAGIALLVFGAFLSLVPGVPGILLAIPAIGLLVARLRFFAVWLDKLEVIARRIWKKLRH